MGGQGKEGGLVEEAGREEKGRREDGEEEHGGR